MPQQIALPEFIAQALDTYERLPPSEVLQVTMGVSPRAEELGRGSPISISGKVTAFGLGVPMLVLIQAARSPETNLSPIALAVSAPLTGDYAVQLDTLDWELGKYAFQALAIPPAGPPGVAPLHFTTLAEPRIGAQLVMSIQGAQSPLDVVAGTTVYVDRTLYNSGNVGLINIKTKANFQVPPAGAVYPASPADSGLDYGFELLPTASKAYTGLAVPTTGMPTGTYDALAWAEFNANNALLPGIKWTDTIRKSGEIKIMGAVGALTTVTWRL
ncbi:MAG: hypothetical protein Q8O40_05955 [Chloroflexota bacterium]|nr:hypothetical protein [Chloroflexota bacterium]